MSQVGIVPRNIRPSFRIVQRGVESEVRCILINYRVGY